MTRRLLTAAALIVVAGAMAWALFVALPRRYAPHPASNPNGAATPAAVPPGRRIKARLFYVGDDGMRLTGVDREVPYADGIAGQAREIVAAQIAPVPDPTVSAIPAGTKLRALFVTDRGEAYVDLSREIATGQGGGPTGELLTVYTIVDALTTNLPGIAAVQILVDGKEVETLAGHVDLRRPLAKNLEWVQ